jgi:hypothetical protein
MARQCSSLLALARARKSAPWAKPAVIKNKAMPGQNPGVSAQRNASMSDKPERMVNKTS